MTRVDQVVARPPAHHVQAAEEGGHRRTVRARSLRCTGSAVIVVPGRQHRCGTWLAVAAGRGPACGPLPFLRCPRVSAGTATMAAGACAPGVASSHDVTGHVVWSGNRTHDRRNQDPLLYPTELSSGEPRGIEPRTGEPVPASSRRSRRWHVRDLRHTPRQRRAHQPVIETGPLENRGCRPPTLSRAIMFGCDADNVQASPLARSKSFGGAGKTWVSERRVAARGAVLASRVLVPTQTKTPPGLAFRGRRQASEIGVADLRRAGIRPLSAGLPCRTRAPARPCAGMAAVWRWRRNARSREVSSGC